MDQSSLNYDSTACYDDGSCISTQLGCMDSLAINFDSNANTETAYGGPLFNYGVGGFIPMMNLIWYLIV